MIYVVTKEIFSEIHQQSQNFDFVGIEENSFLHATPTIVIGRDMKVFVSNIVSKEI